MAKLAAGWQDRCAQWIQAGLPAISSVVRDGDPTMEEASDDELTPLPAPVYVGFTME